jgi:type I restriction enzyme S subunit
MIADLKPYEKYKESGLPWLGKFPAQWVIKRGKSYLYAVDKRSEKGSEELLTVSSARGVVPRRTANVTMFKAESYAGHKLCWPNDLVINSLWAWAGGLGVSQHHGIISTAYSVYRGRPSAGINPRFLHELVRSSAFHWELKVRSKGVWISRLQLTDTAFLDAPIPLPPPDEQAAIVRFLNWADGRLEKAIRAKRRVIALLNEQKQAIIHRAVTRGLNPNVPLKPSGIPWLGDIPRHWEVRRGKYVFTKVDVKSRKGEEELLTVSSSDGVVLRSSKKVMMFKAASYVGHKLCWPEDLVINSLWAWARGLGFSRYQGIVSTAYGVYRLREKQRPLWSYLNELLRSQAYDWELHVRSKGIWKSRLQLTDQSFLDMLIVLPPAAEAEAIVSHVAKSTKGLSNAIARMEREISLMQEYRTRLIADVVTGKLDVREASSKLPDEAPPNTFLEESENEDETADEELVA